MRLLTIVYDSSIEESMSELLEALDVPGWTLVEHVFGRGGRGPRMNSPVFPGTNHLVYLSLPDEEVPRVVRAIRRLQGSYRLKPGITIYSQTVEELP